MKIKKYRKSKLSIATAKRLLKALAEGCSYREAANKAGCNFNTVTLFKSKIRSKLEDTVNAFSVDDPAKSQVSLILAEEILRTLSVKDKQRVLTLIAKDLSLREKSRNLSLKSPRLSHRIKLEILPDK